MISSVLLIEDNLELLESMEEYFRRAGFITWTAQNGAEGLSYLGRDIVIDLIILDLQMPIVDGYRFLKEKTYHLQGKEIPAIVYSGEADSNSLIGTSGVIAAFPKSIEMSKLVNFVCGL